MPPDLEPVTATAGAPPAVGPYVHAVRCGDLLFCSGTIPLDPETGEITGETAADQAVRCLENLAAICAAAGTSLVRRAVRLTLYLVDMSEMGEVNEVYAGFFSEGWTPARFAVGVTAVPRGARIGIDAVVALDV